MKKLLLTIFITLGTASLMATSVEDLNDNQDTRNQATSSSTQHQDVVRLAGMDIYRTRHTLNAWALPNINIAHQIPAWSGEPRFALTTNFIDQCALVTLHVLSGRNAVFAIMFYNHESATTALSPYLESIPAAYYGRFNNQGGSYQVGTLSSEQLTEAKKAHFIYSHGNYISSSRVIPMARCLHPVALDLNNVNYKHSIIYATDCLNAVFSLLSDKESADKLHKAVLGKLEYEDREHLFAKTLSTMLSEQKSSYEIRQAIAAMPEQPNTDQEALDFERLLQKELLIFLPQYFSAAGNVKTSQELQQYYGEKMASTKKLLVELNTQSR